MSESVIYMALVIISVIAVGIGSCAHVTRFPPASIPPPFLFHRPTPSLSFFLSFDAARH